jgi:hypothetical protein
MEKQTAVEWLINKLEPHLYPDFELIDLINQAKEMEKQQQIEFAKWCDNNYNTLKAYNVADLLELYNKTFKNN